MEIKLLLNLTLKKNNKNKLVKKKKISFKNIKKKKKRKYSKFSFFRKEKFLLRMAFCITKKAFVGKILFSLKKLLKNSSQSYVLQLFVYFGISSILGKNCR